MADDILKQFLLIDKVAFITGGARGIGLSIARALASAGADLALVDLNFNEAEKQARELRDTYGRDVIAVRADVTNPESVEQMMSEIVHHFGKINIAFNNAGIVINKSALETDFNEWQRVIGVNLNGVFLTAVAAAKQMIRQNSGGSIINTASMSGHIVNYPQPQASYNASKAAVIQLTKSLAVEWAEHNIRVNSISPGYIGTDLTLSSKVLEPLIEGWKATTPQRRLGRPEELQGIALYLASEASSYATGSDFIVDGGFTTV